MSSSSLRVLRSLVTERLTAAVEEILGLVERVMVEHEEELIRRYGPAEGSRSPDTEKTFRPDVQQPDGVSAEQQLPVQEKMEAPTIKQEPEEELEEAWKAPDVQTEAPQIKVEQDTSEFSYVLESEEPPMETGPPVEVLKVEVKEEDMPSTSFVPPPAAAQSEHADGSRTFSHCKVCGKMFSYRGSLINHAEVHANDEQCYCGVCGQLLPDRQNLLDHLQTHIMAYFCHYCGKTFPRHLDLAVHVRCHTGEKPFSCTVCGKSFARKDNLETHMRMHTNDKPYRCSVCGKCFNFTSSLIRHLRTHTGEKPYSCHYCDKSFLQSTPLKNHMKHHTEERPYYCSECSRNFSDVYSLRRHLKTHDKKPSPGQAGCPEGSLPSSPVANTATPLPSKVEPDVYEGEALPADTWSVHLT